MKRSTPTTRSQERLTTARKGELDTFVNALKTSPKPADGGRLIFALDATLSRERTWDRAMSIQSEMFQEASSLGGLSLKLIYFRGLDECRATGWQTDGRKLARMMQGVQTLGGRTQIARVLSHARKQINQTKVPALIYIGDAVEEDPDLLSHRAGELGLLGCKIFAFHEGRDPFVASVFKSMSKNSGGGYFQFDETSSATLASLLKAVARYASGGRQALEASRSRESIQLLEQMR